MSWRPVSFLCIMALLASCRSSPATESRADELPALPSPALPPTGEGILLTEVTGPAGIDFLHSFGDEEFSNLVEAVGSGAAFFDYDGDGWLDLYLATGAHVEGVSKGRNPRPQSQNRLYRNLRNGTFRDVTGKAGVGGKGLFSAGVAVADYDNDGHADLYVCGYQRSLLYRNNGDGTFSDVTGRAGVANESRFAVAAVWVDYDRDGFADLYVVNYIQFDPDYNLYYAPDGFPGPLAYRGQPDRLYRNRGDGSFEDVSAAAGIAGFAGRGMSAVAVDFNGDGWDDIYVTNDAMENHLFINQEGRRFRENALLSLVAYNGMGDSTASMAADAGDFNGDGRPGLFVSDDALSSLYRNEGDGTFTDLATESGIARSSAQFVGWGAFLFDFDNDGHLDIFKVNSDLSRLFGQEDQLFRNLGQGRFQDISGRLGDYFQRALLGRGACYGDYDNDGDLDVVIVNINSPPVLLRNDGGNRNNWLLLRLAGRRSNRDGLGARVALASGGRTQTGYKRSSSGYLSQNDPRLHFGLGAGAHVERLEILWPSGIRQVLEGLAANRILTVQEPAS